jgi:hypothetical protein
MDMYFRPNFPVKDEADMRRACYRIGAASWWVPGGYVSAEPAGDGVLKVTEREHPFLKGAGIDRQAEVERFLVSAGFGRI